MDHPVCIQCERGGLYHSIHIGFNLIVDWSITRFTSCIYELEEVAITYYVDNIARYVHIYGM
jgi:hypothetical protein